MLSRLASAGTFLRAGWQALTKGTLLENYPTQTSWGLSPMPWNAAPTPETLLNQYNNSPWPHMRLFRLCSAFSGLDFVVKVKGAKGPDDVLREDYPLTQVLRNPNPMLTEYDFRYLTMLYILATGETYWRIIRPSRDTRTWQLWVLPKFWVQVNRHHETREVISYRLPYTKENVAKEDMIWLRSPDPLDPYLKGIGDMLSMATEIETFEYASESDKNFFLRDASPTGYVEVPGVLSATEQQRLKEMWHREYGGANRGRMPILWGNMKFHLLQQNRKEMDFIEGQKWLRDVIIAGIPPEVLGIVENSNRATIEAADYTFSRYEILPRAKWLAASINKWLAPQFDKRIYLEFVRVIPDDIDRLLKAALDPNIGGLQTVRERQGLLHRALGGVNVLEDSEEYGDNYLLPAMVIPFTGEDGKPAPVAPAPAPAPAAEPVETPAPEPVAQESAKALLGFFEGGPSDLASQHDAILRGSTQPRVVTKLGLRDIGAILGALDETAVTLYVFLRPLYHAIMQQRWEQATQEVGVEIGFDVTDPNVSRFLLEKAGRNIRGITQTTQTALRETLAEGVNAGEGIPDLARRISDVFEDAKGHRAVMIARTETLDASNEAALQAYRYAGVEKIEWLLAPDYNPADDGGECEPYDGAVTIIGVPFEGGVFHPPLHVACRCTLIPVIEENGEQRGLYVGEARKAHNTALGVVHARQERAFLSAVKRMWQSYQRDVLVRLRGT